MSEWRVADEGLQRVTRARRAMDAEQMQWLLETKRTGADRELGFASFYDYAESRLEMNGREVYERVHLAEKLDELPALREEMGSLQLCFSTVRELARVCVADTEVVWIEAARGQTVRKVERLVSGHVPGDLPDDPVDPAKRRCRLVLEVNPAELALFKEMRRSIEADAGHRLEDGALVVELASGRLAGAQRNPSTPSYQIAVTVCERCETATQDGAGQVVAVDTAALHQAMCDCHWLELEHAHVGKQVRDVSAATRRAVMARDHNRCRVPGCRSSHWVQLHHLIYRSNKGQHVATNLVAMCGCHHRAVHDGTLVIRGTTSSTAAFLHSDGTPFGYPRGADAFPPM